MIVQKLIIIMFDFDQIDIAEEPFLYARDFEHFRQAYLQQLKMNTSVHYKHHSCDNFINNQQIKKQNAKRPYKNVKMVKVKDQKTKSKQDLKCPQKKITNIQKVNTIEQIISDFKSFLGKKPRSKNKLLQLKYQEQYVFLRTLEEMFMKKAKTYQSVLVQQQMVSLYKDFIQDIRAPFQSPKFQQSDSQPDRAHQTVGMQCIGQTVSRFIFHSLQLNLQTRLIEYFQDYRFMKQASLLPSSAQQVLQNTRVDNASSGMYSNNKYNNKNSFLLDKISKDVNIFDEKDSIAQLLEISRNLKQPQGNQKSVDKKITLKDKKAQLLKNNGNSEQMAQLQKWIDTFGDYLFPFATTE